MLNGADPFEEVEMHSPGLLAALIPALIVMTIASAEQPAIHMVGDDRPPILEQIDVRQELSLLAVAPGGDKAAVALVMNEESKQSTILLHGLGTDRPAEVRVNGLVRDLLFAPDGMSVFGLLHRPAKKREGETYLIGIGLDPAKSRRLLRAPPSARALDYWPAPITLENATESELDQVAELFGYPFRPGQGGES